MEKKRIKSERKMKEEKNTRFGKNGICVLRALRYCGEKNALCNALFFCNEFLFYLLFFTYSLLFLLFLCFEREERRLYTISSKTTLTVITGYNKSVMS